MLFSLKIAHWMHNEEPPEVLLCMLKWCSAALAVTQHNLTINVHLISLPIADYHRLAISITCLFNGNRIFGKQELCWSQNMSYVWARQMRNSMSWLCAQCAFQAEQPLVFSWWGQRKMNIFLHGMKMGGFLNDQGKEHPMSFVSLMKAERLRVLQWMMLHLLVHTVPVCTEIKIINLHPLKCKPGFEQNGSGWSQLTSGFCCLIHTLVTTLAWVIYRQPLLSLNVWQQLGLHSRGRASY